MSTVHIGAIKGNIAKTVLMPGDPKRAEYIAKKFLDRVELVNVVRGMVTYSCSDSNYAKVMDGYEYNYIMANQELNNIIESTANGLGIKLVKGNIFSSDVFYEKTDNSKWRHEQFKALGIEMESFALFNNARALNKKASCLLTVSNTFYDNQELSAKEREQHLDNMIIIALESSLKI